MTAPAPPPPLSFALAYARNAWSVFPCADKRPLIEGGFKSATTNEATIHEWWARWPDAQVAIATGTVSGLGVLDVDPRNGGDDSYSAMVAEHGSLPETKEVLTGGGGRHFYFTLGRPCPSRASIYPGIDLKADGGYVIAPPSLHASGKRYEWEIEAPRRVLSAQPGFLYENGRKPKAAPIGEEIPEGDRSRVLTSMAGSMRRRGAAAAEIRAALNVMNRSRCRPPMTDGEVASIATSVAKYATEADTGCGPARVLTGEFQGRFVSLGELLRTEFPPIDWLVSRILVQGAVGWIGGPPKLGKSMIGLHLALCVSSGMPFLGEFAVKRGRALYVSEEDPPRISFRRVQRMLAGTESEMLDGDSFRILSKAGFKLDREDHLAWLRKQLAAWKPKLVVFDVFNRLHTSEVNKAEDMLPIMQALDRIRLDHECSILTVIHFKKPQEGQDQSSPGGMIAGSLALHAFSECSIYLRKREEKVRLCFEAKEFEPLKDMTLEIESDEADETSRISLSCDGVPDNAEVGATNRQASVTALMLAWEKAGKPEDGILISEAMAEVKLLGWEFSERTLKRHLISSGYRPLLGWFAGPGSGRAVRFHPERRTSENGE